MSDAERNEESLRMAQRGRASADSPSEGGTTGARRASSHCGEPGGPDCTEVLAEVYLLLDKECSREHEAELRRHLDDCPPCLEEYGIREQIKQLLARKCGGDHAPDGLKERLRATIRRTVSERTGTAVEEISVEAREDKA